MSTYLAGVLGIGPRITSSKPVVLPLHHTPTEHLVQPPGIEPGSTDLQTAAMTTSAKVAHWYQRKGSNLLKNANLALKGL